MKTKIFPEILAQMEKKGESVKDLAELLHLDVSQIYRKLNGEVAWTFGDAMTMTQHYDMGLWELFRKENEE